MPTQELKDFVEERLRAYDPDVDLTEGSPAQLQVVDPIVRRFTPDPFEMDIEKFIQTRLTQEFPGYNFREGSGVFDLVVKAARVLLDPMSRETQILKQSQSLAQPELLAESEADALVANIFVSRATGGLSTGTVRLYFNAPVALNLSIGNICYTATGQRFIPTTLQSISAEAMLFNQSGGLYYFDIQVTAEEAGSDYNVDPGAVIGITNLNAAVLVENSEKFEGGLEAETTDELVQKAETAITERSLVVARGISTRLRAQFEDLVHLQVIGMFDAEMNRDVITGGDLGPALLVGTDGYSEDDGNGDYTTVAFKTRYGDFLDVFGAPGVAGQEHYLMLSSVVYGMDGEVPLAHTDYVILPSIRLTADDVGAMFIGVNSAEPSNFGTAKIIAVIDENTAQLNRGGAEDTNMTWILLRKPRIVAIDSIISSSELKLAETVRVDQYAYVWSIHQKRITVSDIPGGILYGDDAAAIEIRPDEIHIGGAADFYIKGTSIESKELVLPSISDELPLVKDVSLIGETAPPELAEFVYDPTKNFAALGVRAGYSLVIESGFNAGTRNILRVGVKPATGAGSAENYLQVGTPLTTPDPAMRYKVVDEIDIDLRQPKTIRGDGADLQTSQLSMVVTTAAAVDFDALGADTDDTLEIKQGVDKGTYTVTAISGLGNRDLAVSAQMRATAGSLAWSLYRATEGISFPLVRITSVDILDSSEQPTGYTVPFANPVDARTASFSNAGRGTKVEVADAVLGIVGITDLNAGGTFPIAPVTDLWLKVNNGATVTIPLGGAVDTTDLLNRINSAVFNVAGTIVYAGGTFLTIRSGDRWIKVLPNATNSRLGLNVAGEDNRQLKSASVTNWTSAAYDLRVGRDVVSVQTGDNIGHLYLIAVEPTRLLVAAFDEADESIRFLHPNMGVKVSAGSRSYGKARVYFLEPTSFQVHGAWHPPLKNTTSRPQNIALNTAGTNVISEDEQPVAYFTANISGANLRFFPDPELLHQVLPAPEEDTPNNLLTTNGSAVVESTAVPPGPVGKNSRAAAIDFLAREIHVGDKLEIPFGVIQGSTTWPPANGADLRPVAQGGTITYPTDLATKTLVLSLGANPPKTVTFSDQLQDQDDVVEEINVGMGEDIAFIETVGAGKYLRLEADFQIVWHAISSASAKLLGTAPFLDFSNRAANDIDGYYDITYVGRAGFPDEHTKLGVSPIPPSGSVQQAQHFTIHRPGVQRLHSTLMNDNVENGLYYMDVELISEGVGDEWNLGEGQLLTPENYDSDGYHLIVEDPNLSYSTEEDVRMVLSRKIVAVGQTDRPDYATQLANQNIQVNYERSPLTSSIQAFSTSDLERVLNASLLVRHLQPHYLNFALTFRGGSSADIVTQDIMDHLAALGPDDRVEVSDLEDIARRRSADYVQNPIELIAVVHDAERSISVDRSENYVTKGRLSAFFPGTIEVTRETST